MDPADLFRLLREAVGVGDAAALEALCRRHQDVILERFPHWRTLPPDLRDRPAEAEQYIQTMIAVARLFDEKLGQPGPLQSLMGDARDNPLVRWQQDLEQSRKDMEAYRYREAIQRLNDLLIDVRHLRGSGADAYLPITYGYLGESYFQSGAVDRSVGPTLKALELCERAGDAEGMLAYFGNLYEIHRWLGHADEAAGCAERLAELHDAQGQADEAARYRRQAERVRAGEPLNRLVAEVDGRRYEMDDLLRAAPAGRVRFLFERNRLTLRLAGGMTELGEQEANQGRFEQALHRFRDAVRVDGHAPHPHYQAALTLLYLQRYADAAAEYARTEELAPGWFQCRSGLWLARQMEAGRIGQQTFLAWHTLADGPLPPREKVRLAERTLAQAPDVALLYVPYAKALRELGNAAEAETALRRGLECAEEPDVRTRLLVDLAVTPVGAEEKQRLLEEAAALNGNLVAGATAALMLHLGS